MPCIGDAYRIRAFNDTEANTTISRYATAPTATATANPASTGGDDLGNRLSMIFGIMGIFVAFIGVLAAIQYGRLQCRRLSNAHAQSSCMHHRRHAGAYDVERGLNRGEEYQLDERQACQGDL